MRFDGRGLHAGRGHPPGDPASDLIDRPVVRVEPRGPLAHLHLAVPCVRFDQAQDLTQAFVEMVAINRFVPAPEARLGRERRPEQCPQLWGGVLHHADRHAGRLGACPGFVVT